MLLNVLGDTVAIMRYILRHRGQLQAPTLGLNLHNHQGTQRTMSRNCWSVLDILSATVDL